MTAQAREQPGFRQEVRAFLNRHLPADWAGIGSLPEDERDDFIASWRALLAENRLLAVTWPQEYGGRGLGKLDHVLVAQEFAMARAPLGSPGDTISIKLMGNTTVRWGTPEQKRTILPRIISGQDVWCQGYSEPEAGSDLASLRTRAALRDGEWHINGQKVWTSNALNANWMFLLARTDPDASPTRGISMLIMPMSQPGVEVRPIIMNSGSTDFTEVFLNDARTSASNIIGEVNQGWKVANSLLSHERGEEAAVNPVLFAEELDRIFDLARERGADSDPLIRARIVDAYARLTVMKAMGDDIIGAYIRDGELGPSASVSKLYWSEYHQQVAELAVDILGQDALTLDGPPPSKWYRSDYPGTPNRSGTWLGVYMTNSLSGTIYAGTSQVQRNLIGEQCLGLPRDIRGR